MKKYTYFFLGFVISMALTVGIPMVESAIPPTPSWKIFEIQTDPWFGSNTNVTADLYNDQVFFVSDGSISFNVTESYP